MGKGKSPKCIEVRKRQTIAHLKEVCNPRPKQKRDEKKEVDRICEHLANLTDEFEKALIEVQLHLIKILSERLYE